MKKYFCVISHTHWDREWYMPFELFRIRLVQLIDHLLDIIEEYPEYVFHLDAQTIVLEDYLEIRPEKYEELKKHITNKNIIVGPWYLQNDFYLTSGEATIRNLTEGRKIAESFGACSNVGYAPDQFGNISQLPQILKGFGIDNFIFGRGYSFYDEKDDGTIYRKESPLEFIWHGADGSDVLAINMRCWYNNAQRIPDGADKIRILTDIIENDFKGMMSTDYYLLMNGVDHLEPQSDLLSQINKFNEKFYYDSVMEQYSLDRYVKKLKEYITDNNIELSEYKGELRNGRTIDILPGTLSSRSYLKIENVKLQNKLEHSLEPLYSMLELFGCEGAYPYDHLRYAYKKLMQNHPHDSICGCSRDEVHAHMEDNFKRLNEFLGEMQRRGMEELFYHTEYAKDENSLKYAVCFINTCFFKKRETVVLNLDFLASDNVKAFKIVDNNGKEQRFVVLKKERVQRDVFSPLNLPSGITVDRYTVRLESICVNPFSVAVLSVKETDSFKSSKTVCDDFVLENDFLKVEVLENGIVNVFSKKTGTEYKDIVYFEDKADAGDAYNYVETSDEAITTKKIIPDITVEESNELFKKVKLSWNLLLPKYYDFGESKRSKEKDITHIELNLSLSCISENLEMDYQIDNKSNDHRLRIVFNSSIVNPDVFSDIPFDIVNQASVYDSSLHSDIKTFPNTSFVFLQGKDKSFSVLTEGIHEAEIIEQDKLALTLIRSTGVISHGGGAQWSSPENQCIRTISGRLETVFCNDDLFVADIPNKSISFGTRLLCEFYPTNRKVFSSGTTAVQDTRLKELYYLPDKYPTVSIKNNSSAISVIGNNIAVSALKLAENKKDIVLRLYNYGNNCENVEVQAKNSISITNLAENETEPIGDKVARLSVPSKKILTFLVK